MVYNKDTLEPLHDLTPLGVQNYMHILEVLALENMYIRDVLSRRTYENGKMIPTLHPLQTFDEYVSMTKEKNMEAARRMTIRLIDSMSGPRKFARRAVRRSPRKTQLT